MANIFQLFGGGAAAGARQAAQQAGAMRSQQVANNVAAGAARGGVNPLALARTQSSAQMAERNAQARQQAQMMAAGQMQDESDTTQLIGTGLNALGSIGGMLMGGPAGGAAGGAAGNMLGGLLSDERAKTGRADGSRQIDQFLEASNPETFTYTQGPDMGERRAGVMAQDIAQSEVGQTMVQRGPEGMLTVDPQAAVSALLAGQARLHDRLDAVEKAGVQKARKSISTGQQPEVDSRALDRLLRMVR